MVKNVYYHKRLLIRINRHYLRKNVSDKVVVENSKISYAQYFIIPSIFTFVGIQYFKQSNYDPTFLLLIVFGGLFSLGLNIYLTRKFRKNPEIILSKIGITFSNTRTIFWNEIEWYHLQQRNSILRIFIKCENEEFFVEFKNLPISRVTLKVLLNSFYKKYNQSEPVYKAIIREVVAINR